MLSSPMSERTFSLCNFICFRHPTRQQETSTTRLASSQCVPRICYRHVWGVPSTDPSPLQPPRMETEKEIAVDNAPVSAKWTPDAKNGSMKAWI